LQQLFLLLLQYFNFLLPVFCFFAIFQHWAKAEKPPMNSIRNIEND